MNVQSPGLVGRLAILTVLLVSLAVAAVSIFGIRTLRGLAEVEALTRVELAVASAREAVRQSSEELITAARVLGERPTLQRLLQTSDLDALMPYLALYCEGAAFDGCAVVRRGAALATVGDGLEWELILAAAAEQGEGFFVTGAAPGVALVGARAPAIDHPDAGVLAVRRMDDGYAARLSEHAGLDIEVVDYLSFRAGEGVFAILDSDALARDESVTARVDALGVYAASLPMAAPTGEIVVLLHALLPVERVMRRVDRMINRMLLVAVVVTALATTGGVIVGRWWIAGVRRLTAAARRLAQGDLATAMPAAGGKELSVLANTMEEMRSSLVELTGELRRREAEAQAVLGGIVEGVYAVDDSRRIRFLNPQAERLLNVSSAQANGRFCGDVLKPALDERGLRPCAYSCPILLARRGGSAQALEQIEPVPGRVRRVVIASAAPSDGIQVQVVRDETELEAARRTRDNILANISHEFRTPLAAQLASIELLRDGLDSMTPEARRELVSSLERGGQRLTWLIDNLLESVRIESGQLAIRRQDVRIDDVVGGALELIEPLIEQRGQRVMVEPMQDLPVIRGDEQRLMQVMINLLANASKFAPTGSAIHVGARTLGPSGVELWVDDEGPGPVASDDSALFERFHRASGQDPDESGLGLGLYIVRSIVERHGGRVALRRTPQARTRAEVALPTGIAA